MPPTPWNIKGRRTTFECEGWAVTILDSQHPKLMFTEVVSGSGEHMSIMPNQDADIPITILKDMSPTPMPLAVEQAIREACDSMVRIRNQGINEVIANLQTIIDADNRGQDIPRHIDVAAVLGSAIETINLLRDGQSA